MDRAEKIFSILLIVFGIMLALCLFLSVASVAMLSKSRESAAAAAAQNEERMEDIFMRLERIEQADRQTDDESIETNIDALGSNGFLIRELDGKIGVYTKSGALLKVVDIPIKLFPRQEQQAIQNGIEVDSIDELLKIMQDICS